MLCIPVAEMGTLRLSGVRHRPHQTPNVGGTQDAKMSYETPERHVLVQMLPWLAGGNRLLGRRGPDRSLSLSLSLLPPSLSCPLNSMSASLHGA